MKYRIIQRGDVYIVQKHESFLLWDFWSDILNIAGFPAEYDTVEEAEVIVGRCQERDSRKEIVIKEYL